MQGLAIIRAQTGNIEEALKLISRACANQPNDALLHYNRAQILETLRRYSEALASYEKAIALRPDAAEAHCNRADILHKLGRYDEALASYNDAIALDPNNPEAKFGKSCLVLLLGNYGEGWVLYESRWQTRQMKKASQRVFSQPLWLGQQPVAGKTILLHTEQGFGDTFQFVRYASMVEALGAKVVLEVPAALVALMSSLDGDLTQVAEELVSSSLYQRITVRNQ